MVFVRGSATGVIDRWTLQLASIFAGAVNVMLIALGISVGILMFFTKVRAVLPPR